MDVSGPKQLLSTGSTRYAAKIGCFAAIILCFRDQLASLTVHVHADSTLPRRTSLYHLNFCNQFAADWKLASLILYRTGKVPDRPQSPMALTPWTAHYVE